MNRLGPRANARITSRSAPGGLRSHGQLESHAPQSPGSCPARASTDTFGNGARGRALVLGPLSALWLQARCGASVGADHRETGNGGIHRSLARDASLHGVRPPRREHLACRAVTLRLAAGADPGRARAIVDRKRISAKGGYRIEKLTIACLPFAPHRPASAGTRKAKPESGLTAGHRRRTISDDGGTLPSPCAYHFC